MLVEERLSESYLKNVNLPTSIAVTNINILSTELVKITGITPTVLI
jgi:hypothetical protein